MTALREHNSPGRWEIARLLCRLAGGWLTPADYIPLPAGHSWEALIEAASYHLVTPTLAYCLRGRGDVPQPVSEYLDGVFFLNRERNETLVGGLAAALKALNAAGIQPTLLKGIASIASGLYPDPAMRILGDIDLLVQGDEGESAARMLASLGFEAIPSDRVDYGEHHHLAPQRDPVTGMIIELHVRPVLRQWDRLLDAISLREQARPIRFQGSSVLIPSPTHRMIHNIVHNQLSDRNYAGRQLNIRQVLELAALVRRHVEDIDWPAVRRTFETSGQLPVLQDTLEIVESLFGVSARADMGRSAHRPVPMLQRELDKSDLSWLFERYAQAIMKRPVTLVRAFQPRSWKRIRTALQSRLRSERW
jgi:hypothetical protein